MKPLLISFVVLCVSVCIQCANILVVAPSFDFNHKNLYTPLWTELAGRGHQITLLTSGRIKSNENITQINFFSEYLHMFKKARNVTGEESIFPFVNPNELGLMAMPDLVHTQFKDPAFASLMGEKFDLMMLDMTLPYWPVLSGIFGCPLIGFSAKDVSPVVHAYLGNAMHPALYPWQEYLTTKSEINFDDRTLSTWYTIVNYFFTHYVTQGGEKKLMRKYFGTGWPSNFDYLSNTSLIFINANPIFYAPRPVTPTTVNLNGFLSIRKPKKLPEDLQKYLDESKHGCIYVSFGSTVNSNYLTDEQKGILVQVFEEMAPMRILWKFDDVNAAKGAKNIEIRTWLPQQDVLRHPNVKLFITQGGLQSMEEAIDSAVPMLGMPFYGDQFNNVFKMRRKEFGLSLLLKDMDKKSLKSALEELLKNPMYKKNIDKYSAISKDLPMRGLEKAVWWTEYVLRHGGTEHLRSPSADIPLYQYYFLDVIVITLLVLSVIGALLRYLFLKIHALTFKYITYPLLYRPKPKKE